jgi:hypothetical protein
MIPLRRAEQETVYKPPFCSFTFFNIAINFAKIETARLRTHVLLRFSSKTHEHYSNKFSEPQKFEVVLVIFGSVLGKPYISRYVLWVRPVAALFGANSPRV